MSSKRKYWCIICSAGPMGERGVKIHQTSKHNVAKYDIFEGVNKLGPDNQDVECPVKKSFIKANNAIEREKIQHIIDGTVEYIKQLDAKIDYFHAQDIAKFTDGIAHRRQTARGLIHLNSKEHNYNFELSKQAGESSAILWRVEKDN